MDHLAYDVDEPLSIPADVFSSKGVAVLLITGASYGGAWVMSAWPIALDGSIGGDPIGTITTAEAPGQPDRALTAVRAWLESYCEGTPFSLVRFESLNRAYGPVGAPFSSVRAAIAIPIG